MNDPHNDHTLTVGELRKILADSRIPDDAEVRCDVTDDGRHHWGEAYDAMYFGYGNFWVQAAHPKAA